MQIHVTLTYHKTNEPIIFYPFLFLQVGAVSYFLRLVLYPAITHALVGLTLTLQRLLDPLLLQRQVIGQLVL